MTMEDFIRVWPNKLPQYLCQRAIQAFEEIVQEPHYQDHVHNNAKQFSESSNLGRRDLAIFLQTDVFNQCGLCDEILEYLHSSFLEYIEEFGQYKSMSLSNRYDFKMQRTLPLGGYHVWHYESDSAERLVRHLVWMIYLNDMPAGEAETEFLYQGRRIVPTQGTIVLWPAGPTHIHRGNPVYSRDKYILTGWYDRMPDN
jgi:hypothetical protein